MTMTLIALTLAACGPAYDPDKFWVVDESSATKPEAPEVDEDDEDGERGFGRELEKVFAGELVFVDGELAEALVGFYYTDSRRGGELCAVSYLVESVEEVECGPCVQAWSLTLGEAEAEINEGGACEAEGFMSHTGSTLALGLGEDALLRQSADGWEEVGYAELEDGAFFFEQELPVGGCGGGSGAEALLLLGLGGLRRRRIKPPAP